MGIIKTHICKCGKLHFYDDESLEKCTPDHPLLFICLNCNRVVSFVVNFATLMMDVEKIDIMDSIEDCLTIKGDNGFCNIIISKGNDIYYSNQEGSLFKIIGFDETNNELIPSNIPIDRKKPSPIKADTVDYKETRKHLTPGKYASFRQWYENNIEKQKEGTNNE